MGACACPEIPLPDVWLPWVIKEHNKIKDAAQADDISDKLFVYFKHCLSQMHTNTVKLPDYAKFELDNYSALQQWCTGLLTAHSAREKFWQGAWEKMQKKAPELAPTMAKDLRHCLDMFTTFAEPEKVNEKIRMQLPLISKSLHLTLANYVSLSGELAAYLPNQFESFTQKA